MKKNEQKFKHKIANNSKGITLVALVITIIILLILAGVAIANSINSEGIIQKTDETAKTHYDAAIKEAIKVDLLSKQAIKAGALTEEEILETIASYDKDGEIKNNSYIEPKEGYKIKIYEIHDSRIGVEVAPGIYQEENDSTKCYIYDIEGWNNINKMFQESKMTYANIEIMRDIDYSGTNYSWIPSVFSTNTTQINGNGNTISNMTIAGQAMFTQMATGHDVIIKNITFDNAAVSSTGINTSILCVQTYNNLLLENVIVKNSSFTGKYKVAPLVGTVYNESSSQITLTIRNCKVQDTIVKSTQYDFYTCGMVAFVNVGDNDNIVFEGENIIENVILDVSEVQGYDLHAFIYATNADEDIDALINSSEGVTVRNVTVKTEK